MFLEKPKKKKKKENPISISESDCKENIYAFMWGRYLSMFDVTSLYCNNQKIIVVFFFIF